MASSTELQREGRGFSARFLPGDRKRWTWLAAAGVFTLLVLRLCSNLKAAHWGCFNGFDIGIYHQELIEIAAGNGFNPYLTTRGLPAFCDHFNPASLLAAGFLKLTNLSVGMTVFWEWLTVLTAVFVFWKKRAQARFDEFVLAFFLLSFSAGILNALEFAVHVDFWSIPVWALILAAWLENRNRDMVGWLLLLGFFKESYPFCIVTFGFYLFFFEKKRGVGGAAGLVGISLLALAFLRPLWLGPVHPYGPTLLKPLLEDPVRGVLNLFGQFHYKDFLCLFFPLGLLNVWHLYGLRDRPLEQKKWWGLAFLLLPLFSIQFIFGTFGKHYSFSFFVTVLFLIYRQGGLRRLLNQKRAFVIFVLVFFISGFESYRSAFDLAVLNHCEKCDLSEEKRESQRDLTRLFEVVHDEKVASSGGILVPLLRPGLRIFQIWSFSEPQDFYDYLLLERHGSGDAYPLTPDQVEEVIAACRPFAEQVLKEDRFFFFARGHFPQACLGKRK